MSKLAPRSPSTARNSSTACSNQVPFRRSSASGAGSSSAALTSGSSSARRAIDAIIDVPSNSDGSERFISS
jgi:hypothetical protein